MPQVGQENCANIENKPAGMSLVSRLCVRFPFSVLSVFFFFSVICVLCMIVHTLATDSAVLHKVS